MLNSVISGGITLWSFLICIAVSLVLGIGVALVSGFRARCTQSFALTLAVLPAAVGMVIMLVNGNIGAGVAVAGAFGLVRFRSAPGSAREICEVFIAMAIGLSCGMGYVVIAALFFCITAVFILILAAVGFGAGEKSVRKLRVTIPEDLDWDGVFDDIFAKYAKECELERVKTTNMGTLYELEYRILPKGELLPKEFFDELRCRNGNLTVSCSKEKTTETL